MKYIYTYLFCFITCLAFSQDSSYVCYVDEVELFPLDNINTKSIEFSPVYYQTGIVYVLAREKNKVIDPKTAKIRDRYNNDLAGCFIQYFLGQGGYLIFLAV